MNDILRATLRSTWTRNAAYAERLVGDIPEAEFIAQPVPGRTINHPAWILAHLNLYATIVVDLLLARPFEDPLGKPYGRGSRVTLDAADYPRARALVERFVSLHADGTRALDAAPDQVFGSATPLERLRGMSPTVGELLAMLVIKHESFHLGQLSAWRRAMGLPPVEM